MFPRGDGLVVADATGEGPSGEVAVDADVRRGRLGHDAGVLPGFADDAPYLAALGAREAAHLPDLHLRRFTESRVESFANRCRDAWLELVLANDVR